jgi:hypothetical protein
VRPLAVTFGLFVLLLPVLAAASGVVPLTALKEPTAVHDGAAGWAEDPAMALTSDYVFVAYGVTEGDGSHIYLSPIARKGQISKPETVRVDRAGQLEFAPAIALDATGDVWVAWTSVRSGTWAIRATRVKGMKPQNDLVLSRTEDLPGQVADVAVASGHGLTCFTWAEIREASTGAKRWRVMGRIHDGKLGGLFELWENGPGFPAGRPAARVMSADSVMFAWDEYDARLWDVNGQAVAVNGLRRGQGVGGQVRQPGSFNWEPSLAGGPGNLATAWHSVPPDSVRCQPVVVFEGGVPMEVGLGPAGTKENWRVKCLEDGKGRPWVAWTTRFFYRNTDLYLRRIGPAGMSRACKIDFPVRKVFMNNFDCKLDGSFYVVWDHSGSIYLGEVTARELDATGVPGDELRSRDQWAGEADASDAADESPAWGPGDADETPLEPVVRRRASTAAGDAAAGAFPYSVFYEGESLHVYFGDCHNHTSFSDGRAYPDISLAVARDRRHLDFAAITDHDVTLTPGEYAWSAAVAGALSGRGEFAALAGFEVSKGWAQAGFGHWTLLFPSGGKVLHFEDGMTPPDLYAFAHSTGALTIPHHVAKRFAPHDWTYFDPVAEAVVEMCSLHGIFETSAGADVKPDMVAGRFIADALARGYVFGLVGGSDSHNCFKSVKVEQGLTGVYARSLVPGDIFDALARRRTFALSAGRTTLDFRCNGRLMGEEVVVGAGRGPGGGSGGPGGPVPITFTGYACSADSIVLLEIVSGGQVVWKSEARTPEARLHWETPAPASRAYYYLRATTATGDLAWSSPIWIVPQQ